MGGRAAAAETRATRLAASAAGLLGSPRPGGTRSPRPPSVQSEGRAEGHRPKSTRRSFFSDACSQVLTCKSSSATVLSRTCTCIGGCEYRGKKKKKKKKKVPALIPLL